MIKNWKLMLLAVIFIGIFSGLGMWQVMRAQEKKTLLQDFANRTKQPPLPLAVLKLKTKQDLRFNRIELTGKFDNRHTILLDNKTYHGQIGYEVYTPFHADGLNTAILIDRGFIAIGKNRQELPPIDLVIGKIKVTGMLNTAPIYYALGNMVEAKMKWPLRVEYLNLAKLAEVLHYPLYRYILALEPAHPASYQVEWKIVMMGPERHMGYAVQWFALALTLLIISVLLIVRKPKP